MKALPTLKRTLPAFPTGVLTGPAEEVLKFYNEHLQRDGTEGKLKPTQAWVILNGLLTAGAQTYNAIRLLLSERRPTQLLLQAGVLNRLLFELFATTLGILENPSTRTQMLLQDAHNTKAKQYEHLNAQYGNNPDYQEHLEVYKKGLPIMAEMANVDPKNALHAKRRTNRHWPTPGAMVNPQGKSKRGTKPFVSGKRGEVLKRLYDRHYNQLSAQAHGRIDAVGTALLAGRPGLQWNPGHGKSSILCTAVLFICCTVSELETAGTYEHHRKLAELWTYLREMNDEASELWELRYKECFESRNPNRT